MRSLACRASFVSLAASLAVGALFPAALSAGTIKVSKGGAITTINGGVLAAGPGDTVLVKPGTYQENVSIPSGKDGLKLKADGKVVIEACGLLGAKLGAGIIVDSADVSISGFTIQNAKTASAQLKGRGIHGVKSGLAVSNCTIRGCDDDSMLVENGDDTKISKCTLHGNGDGIEVIGDDVLVASVEASNINGDGIIVNGNGAKVTKCKLLVVGNKGIELSGTDAVIEKNSVEDSEDDGILAISADGAVIRKNVVRRTVGYCISAAGADLVIDSNDVGVCNGGGIFVAGTGATVKKNKVDGIAGSSGIEVDGDDPAITDNELKHAGANAPGIAVVGATTQGLIARNEIEAVSSAGIDVSATCSNLDIEENVVENTGDSEENGFEIRGNSHSLVKNVAKRSSGDGFNVNGNNVTLDGNKAIDNAKDGIDIAGGSGVVVMNCVATGNAAEGIENNANGTTITDNKSTKNRIDFANSGTGVTFTGNTSGDGSDDTTLPEIDT